MAIRMVIPTMTGMLSFALIALKSWKGLSNRGCITTDGKYGQRNEDTLCRMAGGDALGPTEGEEDTDAEES